MQISAPEAMCITDNHSNYLTTVPSIKAYTAVGLGPGLSMAKETVQFVKEILQTVNLPLVIDADALNILSANQDLIDLLSPNAILTPHIKEFDRLVGPSKDSEERFSRLKEFSKDHRCIVVLKDAHTCVADPEGNLYFNTSGNPGMATGGSGDVLTGIITGLLAQHYSPLESALLGVYFHGLAGDKAAEKTGQNAVIASDIIDNLSIECCGQ